MSHCSLSPESIFVTPGGDFKLGNFSLLQQVGGAGNSADEDYFRTYEAFLCPTPYRCPERDNGDHAALLTTLPSHIMDSYSLGQLIEDLYTDVRLAVPEKLLKALARLKTPKTQQRPRVAPLLRCPALDTPHVKSMYFLSDIDVKPAEEKISFLQSVPDQVTRTVLTRDALKHKLLPSMMRSLQNIARNPAAIGQDVNRREGKIHCSSLQTIMYLPLLRFERSQAIIFVFAVFLFTLSIRRQLWQLLLSFSLSAKHSVTMNSSPNSVRWYRYCFN
jgi:hypothetical protein